MGHSGEPSLFQDTATILAVFEGIETPIYHMYILTKKTPDEKVATCQCATPMLCSYGFLLRDRSLAHTSMGHC